MLGEPVRSTEGATGTATANDRVDSTYAYNGRGYLATVTDTATADVLETYTGMNAFGQVTGVTYGNDVATAWGHDARMGRLTGIRTTLTKTENNVETTTTLQDNTYAWRSDGILRSRMAGSGATARTEAFGYDLLNRMTSAALTVGTSMAASRTLGYSYDRLGNVTQRSSTTDRDVGSMAYGTGNAGPNALTSATLGTETHRLSYSQKTQGDTTAHGGRVIRYTRPGADAHIDWNGRGLAQTITVGDSAADSAPEARDRFAYGPDGRRYHRQTSWDDNGTQRTEHTFYVGGFEERTLDGHASYASVQKTRVSAGVLQVRKVRKAPATGAETAFEYLHRDHLGSVEKVTDANGAELLVLSYDPFGSRRKSDWTRRLTDPEHGALIDALKLRTSEGFSGHSTWSAPGSYTWAVGYTTRS